MEHARAGSGGCLFIRGDAGLGKTSVLAEGRRMAKPHLRVGFGRADAMESWFPFGVMSAVLLDLGGPDLMNTDQPLGRDTRAARFMAVLTWLQSASGEPMLLVIDDLHWADPDSLGLIAFLARRLGNLHVAVLASLRPWPSHASDVTAELAVAGHAQTEQLEPLSRGSAARLIEDAVGLAVPPDVVERAHDLCTGNPLLLQQVARTIRRGEGMPAAIEGDPSLVEGLLLTRFASLPPDGMRLAQAGSVLGVAFRADVAADVAQLDAAVTVPAIEALTGTGLVNSIGGSVLELVHPIFRRALYDGMAPAVRTLLHRRAFSTLSLLGLETEAAEHAVRGELGGDKGAIELLARVGRRALAAGALQTAVIHLAGAAGLAMDGAPAELLMGLGEAQVAAGHVKDSCATLRRVLTLEQLSGSTEGYALRLLAHALYMSGDRAAADSVFDQAVTRLQTHDRSAAIDALIYGSFGAALADGMTRASVLAERARELSKQADDETRNRANAVCAYVRLWMGDGSRLEDIGVAARAIQSDAELVTVDSSAGFDLMSIYAGAAGLTEQWAEAERVHTIILNAAERAGALTAIANLSTHKAWLLTRLGRLDEALQLLRRALSLADLIPFIECYAAIGQSYVLQLMGHADESERLCRQSEAAARGQIDALVFAAEIRGHGALREGRLHDAAVHYRTLESAVAKAGYREPCLGAWARHAVAAYVGCNQEGDARRVIAWVEDCARGLPCVWPRIAAATSRAMLAHRQGDNATADGEFRKGLALHETTELPIEEAETLLEYGAFLRRTGQSVRARPLLARALEIAERTNAMWIVGFVRAELTVAGGRRRRSGSLERLTAQERRVADLAAAGLSNRELAARLSLSIPTIETHLQRIYGKLEIHSRRELMTKGVPDRLS
ncbi:MAG: LuxR C-terminal-related transcriptional regulator [Candidatus Dormibacteraeota bacterium]|nr:LuxR C-terminal-related transcriptional regulator [Candidatus Dormibacteraeota bacterium]